MNSITDKLNKTEARMGAAEAKAEAVCTREYRQHAFWPMFLFAAVNLVAWWAALTLSIRIIEPWQMRMLHVVVFMAWTLAFSELWRGFLRLRPNLIVELGMGITVALASQGLEHFLRRYGHNTSWHGVITNLFGVGLAGTILWRYGRFSVFPPLTKGGRG
jgi:hypothetical protein